MQETSHLRTNRDLYLFVAELCPRRPEGGEPTEGGEPQRSLEDYLKALWQLGSTHRRGDVLSLPTFAGLLAAALRHAPPPFDGRWPDGYTLDDRALAGYARWERTILNQLVDLYEMQDAGTLADEQRYFGVDAPRGPRWYNFDPLTFLECAVAGRFGGWRSGDPTERDLVPGEVAVLDEEGNLSSADPRELEEPICSIEGVSWDLFADFLLSGQYYE